MPEPANPLVGDIVLQFSSRLAVYDALRAGSLPWWNEGIMAGHPLASDVHAQPFDPLHWALAWTLDPLEAYDFQLLAGLFIAGATLFLWLRLLGARRSSSVAGGVAYMLAGYHLMVLAYPPFITTAAWLPGVAAGWEAGISGRRWGIPLGGACLGLAILGGQLQMVGYGVVALAFYALLRIALDRRGDVGRGRPRARMLATGIGVVAAGTFAGAAGWLPAVAASGDIQRPPFTLGALRATALPVDHLVTLVVPWSFGDPRISEYRGAQNPIELMAYVGIIPLVLLALGLALSAGTLRRRESSGTDLPSSEAPSTPVTSNPKPSDPTGIPLVAAAVTALIVMLIAIGSPLAWPLASIPGVNRFGLMRWLSVWPLFVAAAAGLTLDWVGRRGSAGLSGTRWSEPPPNQESSIRPALSVGRALVPICGAVATIALFSLRSADRAGEALTVITASLVIVAAWVRRPSAGAVATLTLMLTLDLLLLGRSWTLPAPKASAYAALAPVPLLRDTLDPGERIAVLQRGPIAFAPSVPPTLGLPEIGGYTSTVRGSYSRFISTLGSAPENEFLQANANMVAVGDVSEALLRMLNVRLVVASEPLAEVAPELHSAEPCLEWLPLETARSESFLATESGFNRVDVVLRGEGRVAIHVLDHGGGHVGYGEAVGAPEPVTRTLYFEPQPESDGVVYEVRLDSLPGQSSPGPDLEACAAGDRPVFAAYATARPRWPLVATANGLSVYEPPTAMGPAWLVDDATPVESQSEALAIVADGQFDVANAVAVEAPELLSTPGDPGPEPRLEVLSDHRRGASTVQVTERGVGRRSLTVRAESESWLVVSDAFAEGWRATVDDQSVPVRRANGGILAVPVPAGTHSVSVEYRPWAVRAGVFASLLGFAALAVIGGWSIRHRDRNRA